MKVEHLSGSAMTPIDMALSGMRITDDEVVLASNVSYQSLIEDKIKRREIIKIAKKVARTFSKRPIDPRGYKRYKSATIDCLTRAEWAVYTIIEISNIALNPLKGNTIPEFKLNDSYCESLSDAFHTRLREWGVQLSQDEMINLILMEDKDRIDYFKKIRQKISDHTMSECYSNIAWMAPVGLRLFAVAEGTGSNLRVTFY